jgi:hypothetical protein
MAGTVGKSKPNARMNIAAALVEKYPDKRHIELARMVGLKTRQGFSMRIVAYKKAIGTWRPRRRRFRFKLLRSMQQG